MNDSKEIKKKRILIIEDEKTLLAAIRSKLILKGYDVLSAEDGEEGELLIKKEKPDLVLLDIILPKKGGFEILEDLKKEGISDVPIIIISNSGQPVEVNRALELGVKDYLIKADFKPSDVLERVVKAIGLGFLPEENKKEVVQQSTAENSASGNDSSSARKYSVLLVEDDEFLRQLVAQKLIKEGFDVDAAIDSTAAFKSIEEKKPHVILLDLILPGMDGFEILSQLKKNPANSDIPVIVLSNLGQQEDIDRAMSSGAESYMIKANFTPGEIVQAVRKVIREKYV